MVLHMLLTKKLISCAAVFKYHIPNLVHCSRTFFVGKYLFTDCESDGKTTVTILNKLHDDMIMINSYSNLGFRLNNGLFVIGPVALFPKTVLQWNVDTAKDINPATLSLFALLEPKIDLLVFGTGDKRVDLNSEVISFLKKKEINYELLSSSCACQTFNFLNYEGRCIAGAIIPPKDISLYEEDLMLHRELSFDLTEQ